MLFRCFLFCFFCGCLFLECFLEEMFFLDEVARFLVCLCLGLKNSLVVGFHDV